MPFDPEKFNEFKKSGFDPDRFSAFKAAQQKPVETRQEPMYDPASGAAIGYTEPAVAPTTMPYGEQMRNVGEFYKEAGKGAALGIPSAVVGMPGDIESLGRFGLNLVGADVERESALPTTERVYSGVRGVFTDEPMSPGEKIGAGVGELIGGFIGPGQAVKGLRAAGEAAVGPGRWGRMSRWCRNRTRQGFWSTRSIPGLQRSEAGRCRRFCYQVIMPK